MNARYVLDKLAIEAAKLPQDWLRCSECGYSYRYDEAAMVMRCPLCAAVAPEEGE